MDSGNHSVDAEAEEARRLALALSSDDVAEARAARETLADWLSPTRTMRLWQNGTAAQLLHEAHFTGDPSVHAAIARGLCRLFDDATVASAFFAIPGATEAAAEFFATSMAHEELTIAMSVRPAFLALLATAPAGDAPVIGAVLDRTLSSPELSLRLFDEVDCADALERTSAAIRFAAEHTSALDRIISAALTPDPLLRASCLAVCGAAGRHVALPERFLCAITEMISGNDVDDVAAASTAITTLLEFHERNAALSEVPRWAAAAAAQLRCGAADILLHSGGQIISALSTTDAGWAAAAAHVAPSIWAEVLRSARDGGRAALLSLFVALARSPRVDDAVFAAPLLSAAWALRSHVEPSLREPLWSFLANGISRPAVSAALALPCASFLSTNPNEPEAAIREMQLRVASRLAENTELTPAVHARLEAFRARGLYAPGSAGVEAMARR